MTKQELIKRLQELQHGDEEINHRLADEALLDYIADDEIREAFEAVDKWYA